MYFPVSAASDRIPDPHHCVNTRIPMDTRSVRLSSWQRTSKNPPCTPSEKAGKIRFSHYLFTGITGAEAKILLHHA